MRELLRRVWRLARWRRFHDELAEEMDVHRAMAQCDLEGRGVDPAEAAAAARRAFGSATLANDQSRDVWIPSALQGLGQDLRLAARALIANRLVSAVAISSLALGIGANTAIFSIINSLLLRSLAVPEPARLQLVTDAFPNHIRAWSYPIWMQVRLRPELFHRAAAWSSTQFNLSSGGEAQLVEGLWASGSFFETVGVRTLVGRTLSDADDQRGGGPAGPVAVISARFWQRQFAGAPDVIGQPLRLDGVPFTIVGVAAAEFSGPEIGRRFDVAVPIADEPLMRGRDSFLDSSGTSFLTIIARLRADQTVESATAELRRAQPQIRDATLGDYGRFSSREAIDRYLSSPFTLAPGATGFSSGLRERYERPLATVMAVVALLLFVACVNIANLLAARAMVRRPELSLRLALGASRWRLSRQLLAESAVLYGIGAVGGVAVASWGSRVLVSRLSGAADAVFLDTSLDVRVLAFALAMTVLATLVSGTAPAFQASRLALMDALKQQKRTTAVGRCGALAGWPLIVQVALSLVLMVAAGLFVRTFVALTKRPLGFDPSHVLAAKLDVHRATNDSAQRALLYERIRQAVRVSPGVTEAALSLTTPVGNGQFTPRIEIARIADTQGPVWGNLISPGWFATFGTPLIDGRDLTAQDRGGAQRVAVVNEAFARKFANGGSPIGGTFTLYPRTERTLGPIEIVGVVRDAVYASLRTPPPPTFYLPLAQFDYLTDLGIRSINLSIRTQTDSPMALTKTVAAALASVDPEIVVTFRPFAEQIDGALAQERVTAALAALFGALALLLSGIGLYGVTAYAVGTRRAEIGIRIALGAASGGIVRLVLSRAAMLVAIGVLIGGGISLWASRFVASLLYGLDPRDPATLIGAVVVLTSVAALAAWLPAARASRIDPAIVLRYE
jgi:putative ABC transport system permease protein